MSRSKTKWEDSSADKKIDRREAKKHKMSMRAWEDSGMDKKMDRAAVKKVKRKK